MRALVVSIWVFINLVFFGMCGYMYLLWSQYWMFMDHETKATTSTYDQQIYFYNRGFLHNDTYNNNNNKQNSTITESKSRIKHSLKDNLTITLIKNSKPRFPNVQGRNFELDTKKFMCWKNDTLTECLGKSRNFKETILKELRRVLEEEGNVLKTGTENPYKVEYVGQRGNYLDKSQQDIICELRKIRLNTLKRGDVHGGPDNVGDYLPKRGLFENKRFNSCAIVASAGALKGSNLGQVIDSYDTVLRFNNAPTKGFERDVGGKTTMRVLNSQVVTKKEFKFLELEIYRNITVVMWDPSDYGASLGDWLEKPEFNLFPNYVVYRKKLDKPRAFVLNPHSLWDLWDFLQANSPSKLRRNPVSSGFLGLTLLLPYCNFVDMFEYVPSVRATKRCHYYDPEDNPACTFGVWHPLAAEKLITFHLNLLDDRTVFQKGYVRIQGFRNLKCP